MEKVFYAEGGYTCEITKQRFGQSPVKGTKAFVLEFRVLKRVDDPDASLQSYLRKVEFWLTPKTVARVREDLRLLGFTGSTISELDPQSADYFSLTGWEVTMYCRHGQDQDGNSREEWSPRGSGLLPLTNKEELEKLDAVLAKIDREEEQKRNHKTELVAVTELGITDDDVPF
jgi:hypothetical protein